MHDRLEAVVEGAQVVGVEPVQPGQLLGAVEAVVAEQPPDQVAVLLLDVGVVVAVEGATPAELDLVTAAVVDQGLVQELDAVVDVHAQEREGQLAVETSKAGQDLALALGHDRHQLGPSGLQVSGGERVDPLPDGPAAAVRDQVDLEIARPGLLAPVADPDRHLALEPTGRAQAAPRPALLLAQLGQVAGDGGGAGRQQQGPGLGRRLELSVLLRELQQVGQEWPQALGADVAGGLPEHGQGDLEGLAVAPAAGLAEKPRLALTTAQHADRVLAGVAGGQAEGVQHGTALPPAGGPVALAQISGQSVALLDLHRPVLPSAPPARDVGPIPK